MPVGGWPDFIREGINGYIIRSEQDFTNAWNNRDNIKQIDCYNTATEHSEERMITQFTEAFKKILE